MRRTNARSQQRRRDEFCESYGTITKGYPTAMSVRPIPRSIVRRQKNQEVSMIRIAFRSPILIPGFVLVDSSVLHADHAIEQPGNGALPAVCPRRTPRA